MGEEEVVERMTEMPSAHFVLVHGVGHGAWCWYKVQTLLESSGHRVTSLDLKGSGTDRSDPDAIRTFDEYNQPLVHFLASLPHQHKVILVGHSAGGMSVTDAIHRFPEKLQAAVYIGATMLKLGFQNDQDHKDGEPDLSEFGDAYDFVYGMGKDQPPTSGAIKKDFRRKILYQMSSLEDCTLAGVLLRPFPLVFKVKFKQGEEEETERVPRVCIKTLQDRVLKPKQQEEMIKRWPPAQVYSIDSDHSPFFSNPFLLSGLLLKVATTCSF